MSAGDYIVVLMLIFLLPIFLFLFDYLAGILHFDLTPVKVGIAIVLILGIIVAVVITVSRRLKG